MSDEKKRTSEEAAQELAEALRWEDDGGAPFPEHVKATLFPHSEDDHEARRLTTPEASKATPKQ